MAEDRIPRIITYSVMVETFRRQDGKYEHKVAKDGVEDFTLLTSPADIDIYKTKHRGAIEAELAKGKNVSTARTTLTSEFFIG